MRSSEIHIGEWYLIRSWMTGVEPVRTGKRMSFGFNARWVYKEMQVVSKTGRFVTLQHKIIRAISRDMETLKVTWGMAIEVSVVDVRNVIRKVESGNGLSQP